MSIWFLNHQKETLNENRNFDRTHFSGARFSGLWPQWFFEFSQHWACTYRTGRTVPRRADSFSLLLGCGSAANCRWRAIAGEPIRTARVGAAWANHREYHLFSRVHESDGSSPGGGGNNIVVHRFLSCSPTLLRNICAAYLRFRESNCLARSLRRIHL